MSVKLPNRGFQFFEKRQFYAKVTIFKVTHQDDAWQAHLALNSASTRGDLPGTALDTSGDQLWTFSIDLHLLQVDESLIESDGV